MYRIVTKKVLNPTITLMEIEAPDVARKALAGQFIIFRKDENSERIPLTVAGYDRQKGTVTIIFQKVGFSPFSLDELDEGDYLTDFVGPLGKPSEFEGIKKACVIGGGLGVAIAYPQAKALHDMGANVDFIVGFRNTDLIILQNEFESCSNELKVMTDDGSNGNKGFVTDALRVYLEAGRRYDAVIAIGPLPMMRAVCDMTKPYGIKTIVSMNSVMIDGTGMCGGCRITVGGKMRFACVDGPDFDGHQVDFDEAIMRSRMYAPEEKKIFEDHKCNLMKGVR